MSHEYDLSDKKEKKKKVAGQEPDLLGDRVPYNHMAEFGRYEEGSPVANEVETNMRAIRNRIRAPKQMEPEVLEKEEFKDAAKRRLNITITVEV